MTSTPDPERAAPNVLVSVHDVREEIRAGFGSAQVVVRTLDGVSLSVHAGEFVIVHGGVASGASSLLAVMAGRRATASGSRHASPSLQIRRGAISEEAMQAMRRAWLERPTRVGQTIPRVQVLYLFRVRSHPAPAARESPVGMHRWAAWARTLRADGGSVLVHVPTTPSCQPDAGATERPQKHSPAVFENTAGERLPVSPASVREFTIASGRIVSAVPATRPMWFRESDGYAPPNACDPYPTTWPVP